MAATDGGAAIGTQNFDYWREEISARFLPLLPERCGPLPFAGGLTRSALGSLPLTTIRAQGQRVRQPALGSPSDGDIYLNLQAAGRMRFDQNGSSLSRTGDGFLIDGSQPFELHCPEPMTHTCIAMSKAELGDRLHRRARLAGLRLDRSRAADALCLDFLSFGASPDGVLRDGNAENERQLVDLLAYAINRRYGAEPLPRAAASAVAFGRAMRYIAANAERPELAASSVAAALGLSLRTLQRIFRERGESPAAAVVAARVDAARRLLDDPSLRKLDITDIGYRSGFSDMSYFCRVFRRRTGLSPRNYRRRR